MEGVTWKLTLPYVKQLANRNLLYGLGNSNRALYELRGVGWGGRREGKPGMLQSMGSQRIGHD